MANIDLVVHAVQRDGCRRARAHAEKARPPTQALFYGIGAAVIGIIAIAAYKLARSTNKKDPLLWIIFAALALVTFVAEAELAEFFILAGVLIVRA